MERLEAALEKARESRRNAQQAMAAGETPKADTEAVAQSTLRPEAAALWHRLKTFKISGLAARKNRITTLSQSRGSGPYDLMRSRALRLMQENGWKTLAITSPNASCGKTTVTANLAFSLARQIDLKILVLDLDLRRPALHKVLSQRPADNFHDVLEGRIRAEDQLLRFGENLAFGLNHKAASKPSELLQSKRAVDKLNMLRDNYEPDLVLIDMPPMLASDDHVGFLPHVDCAMLVSAAESTTMNQLDVCEKELSELTNVLGVVLNKCRFNEADTDYNADYY